MRTVILTVAIGMCTGCTTVVPGSATSVDPVADPPPVGTCLALVTEAVEVMMTLVPRVACDDSSYTAQVFATADLTGLDAADVTDLARNEVSTVIGSACDEATLEAFMGAEPVETPFVFTTFFTPIPSQWELGARWAYCVVAYGNEKGLLDVARPPPYREVLPPPGLLEDAFLRSPAATLRTCSAYFGDVPCSEPHRFEYIGHDVVFPPGPTWPADLPGFSDRLLTECASSFSAYAAELPIGYQVTGVFLAAQLFDPTIDFIASCVAGAVFAADNPFVGSIRD